MIVCEERSAVSFSSDQVLPCVFEDVRPRSNMFAYLLSCPFLLQSVHSTELCRGTAGKLNDTLDPSIHAESRSCFQSTQGSQTLHTMREEIVYASEKSLADTNKLRNIFCW